MSSVRVQKEILQFHKITFFYLVNVFDFYKLKQAFVFTAAVMNSGTVGVSNWMNTNFYMMI